MCVCVCVCLCIHCICSSIYASFLHDLHACSRYKLEPINSPCLQTVQTILHETACCMMNRTDLFHFNEVIVKFCSFGSSDLFTHELKQWTKANLNVHRNAHLNSRPITARK